MMTHTSHTTEPPESEDYAVLAKLMGYVMGFDPHHGEQDMLMLAADEGESYTIPCHHHPPPVWVLICSQFGAHHSGN
eukprot:scaffold261010_cov35-Attheya_sp.AAC.1